MDWLCNIDVSLKINYNLPYFKKIIYIKIKFVLLL